MPNLVPECRETVSSKYSILVNNWWQTVPDRFKLMMAEANHRVIAVNKAIDVDKYAEQTDAGRHPGGKYRSQQPAFYSSFDRALILVENWDKSLVSYKDGIEFPIQRRGTYPARWWEQTFEENSWHHLGHAICAVKIGKLLLRDELFDKAFHNGRKLLKAESNRFPGSNYYHAPDGNGYYFSAKRELFAQLFWLKHAPKKVNNQNSDVLLELFKEFVELMDKYRV